MYKPCPKCGSMNIVVDYYCVGIFDSWRPIARCCDCKYELKALNWDRLKKKWNRRANDNE